MAGIINNTARQYNVNAFDKTTKTIIKVRLKPGINFVDDATWSKVKSDPFVLRLKEEDKIDFGIATNKQVDETDKHQVAQTKKSKAVKGTKAAE